MTIDAQSLTFIALILAMVAAFVLYRRWAIRHLVQETDRLSDALRFNSTILIDSPLPMGVYAANGQCVLVNEALAQLVGASRETLESQNFNGIPSWQESGLRDECQTALDLQRRRQCEIQTTTSFGKMLWVECRILPTPINGQPHLLIQFIDLTDRKHTEEAVQASEAKFSLAFMSSPLAMIITRAADGQLIEVNPAFESMVGYSRAEAVGKTTLDLALWENTEARQRFHVDLLEHGGVDQQEYSFRRKDGTLLIGLLSARRFILNDEPVLLGSVSDITERKQMEEALRESEFRWKYALEGGGEGVWDWNFETDEVKYSRRWKEMLGYAEDEIQPLSQEWKDRIHPDDQGYVAGTLQAYLDQETDTYVVEYRLRCKDGDYKWILGRGMVVNRSDKGQALRMIGTHTDITKRKQAGKALHLTQYSIDHITDGILWIGKNAKYHFVNDAACRMLGYSREELLTMGVFDIDPVFTEAQWAQHWQAIVEQGSFTIETVNKVKGGREFPVEVTFNFVEYEGQQYNCAIVHDITQRKQSEADLKASEERFRSIFTHAPFGIFHSMPEGRFLIANPALAKILGYASPEALIAATIDMSAQIYVDPADRSLIVADMMNTEGWVHRDAIQWRRRDGRIITVDMTGRKVRDAAGEIAYLEGIIEDITERVEAERSLRQALAETQRFREALDHLPAFVFMKDESFRYFFANRTTLEFFGCSAAELLGSDDYRFFPPETVQRLREVDTAILAGGQSAVEIDFINPRGERRVYWETKTPIYADAGRTRITGVCGISTDITERKQTEEALVVAKQAAEAANRAKSEFLANMSHEIRTPMNAILGMAYLALQTKLDARQHDYVTKIHTSAESLLGIINDTLDFSKIEAGKLELEMIPFALSAVFDHLATVVGGKANDEGLEIRFVLPEDVPALLLGDPLRLQQVIGNLANNAVKFTEQGRVVIAVERAGATVDGFVPLTFSVTDTGIGLHPEQVRRMLEPFTQADSSVTRRYGGTGLGLSIVTRLLEQMGSRLEVDSTPGHGSRFAFTLRLAIAHEPQAPGHRQHDPGLVEALRRLRGARVLVVEDNLINQQVAREIIEQAGLQVQVAANGRLAVEALRADADFDAVFMDIQMPEMGGYEATRCIREFRPASELPIIAMTAHALQDERENCLEAGMNDHLAKPIMPGEVQAALVRWIAPKLEAGALPPSARESAHAGEQPAQLLAQLPVQLPSQLPAPLPSQLPGLDLALGLQRASGNEALYRLILSQFREQHQTLVSELRRELENQDLERAGTLVHSLKGLAGTIGARALHVTAGNLEAEIRAGDGDGSRWLARLGTQLDEVLATIATLESIAPPPETGLPPSPPAALQPLFSELEELLKNNNLAAIPLFNRLKVQLGTSPQLEEMDRQINRLNFAAALDRLPFIAVQYGVQP